MPFVYFKEKLKRAHSSSLLVQTNNIMQLDQRRRSARLKFLLLLNNPKITIDASLHLVPFSPTMTRHCYHHSLAPIIYCEFLSRSIAEYKARPAYISSSGNVHSALNILKKYLLVLIII